jgi:hypothetical protein
MAGELRITGLPFTSSSSLGSCASSFRSYGQITLTTNYTEISSTVDANTAYIRLLQMGSDQNATTINSATALGANPSLFLSGFYMI